MDISKSLTEIAKERLKKLEEETVEIQAEHRILMAREVDILQQMNAWRVILTREMLGPEASGVADRLEADLNEIVGGISSQENIGLEVYGSREKAARTLLYEAGHRGMSPKELTDAIHRLGIEVSSSFGGNFLFRMRKKGDVIRLYDGRHVLSEFVPMVVGGEILYGDPDRKVKEASEETS